MVQPFIERLRRARLFLRSVAITVVCAYLGLYLQPVALAARLPAASASTTAKTPATPEEKLSRTLEDIEAQLAQLETKLNQRLGATTEKTRLKTMRQELDALDKQARANFDTIEHHIKDKKLPQVILDRHAEAVRSYRSEMVLLKSNLDSLEIAKDDTERKTRAQKAKEHLKAKQKKQPQTPFDPNSLPHRPAKDKKPKARLKGKEFIEFSKANAVMVAALQAELLIAQATNSGPTAMDLAETVEVQFSPEIVALAAGLNRNPVKLYEFVKNNVVYEPYYGSLKGSRETLFARAGNDFDQASLLIALLRNSGIPARYVYGTVEIPIQKVMNWLGVENENVAADMLATAGIPVTAIVSGGKIASVRMERVWVEAYVSFENYRGHERSGKKQWVPLDPAFKQLRYRPGPDLKQMMQLDAQAFSDGLAANAAIDRTLPSITSVSESYLLQQIGVYQTNLSSAVTATMPGATPQNLVGNYDILTEQLSLLPASLPYRVLVTAAKSATVPDDLRYKLNLTVSAGGFTGGPALSYQTTFTEMAGKKITLAYQPATSADEATLQAYGKLSATPAYLVEMKPILRIDGAAQATGSSIGIGENQTLTLTIVQPGTLGTDRLVSNLTAGGYYAVGLNLQKIPKDFLSRQTDKLNATKSALELLSQGSTATVTTDDVIGDMLHATALGYFYNLGASQDLIARFSEVVLVRQPSSLVSAVSLSSSFVFGIPTSVRPVGLNIDVQRNVVTAFSRSGDTSRQSAFMLQSGTLTSALEHIVFAQLFNVNAVSTAKVMQLANSSAMPIYAINGANKDSILPLLQIESAVRQEIEAAIQAGMIVMVPKQNILYDGWQGTGYLIFDPATTAGAYRISGGINGGATSSGQVCLQGDCLQDVCIVPGDWTRLLDDIDQLLVLANIAFLGQIDLQSIANTFCLLLQGMDPDLPERIIQKAETILRNFSRDAAILVLTLALAPVPLDLTPEGLMSWTVTSLTELASTGHLTTSVDTLRFGGFFIIHYLYEYLVLFRLNLFNAFPDF